MQEYLTAADFNSTGSGLMPYISSIVTAIPPFFSIMLFVFWIAINAVSYFSILAFTGKKRFFHTFMASSFVMFIVSVVLAAMNTATITYLSGYWVGFYIVMVAFGWVLLENYK